jgi:hypothetical protein
MQNERGNCAADTRGVLPSRGAAPRKTARTDNGHKPYAPLRRRAMKDCSRYSWLGNLQARG